MVADRIYCSNSGSCITIWGEAAIKQTTPREGCFYLELMFSEAKVIYEALQSIFDEKTFNAGRQLEHAKILYNVLKEQFGGEDGE